jgi:hypothetical protein
MADIICVIGNKGGTGKTTLSHMLCHGLGLLGQRSVCVLTDVHREPLAPAGRRYLVADARSREALDKVVGKVRLLKDWMGVVDGGGSRGEADRRLYALADLALLPFRDSDEDIRAVMRDLELFPQAYAIPTQWPTNPWRREVADRAVQERLAPWRGRILRPAYALASSKLLLQHEIPATVPTPLANAARGAAHQVLDLLQIPLERPADAGRRRERIGRNAPPAALAA